MADRPISFFPACGVAPSVRGLAELSTQAEQAINDGLTRIVSTVSTHPQLRGALTSALFPGKRIRPLLLYIGVERIQGRVPHRVLALATALELIHRASLLVDDVVDQDIERRNLPAFHAQWGPGTTLVVSHQLVSMALQLVSDEPDSITKVFLDAYHRTCQGQLADMNLRSNDRNSFLLFYLDEVTPKTASLFELATSLIGITTSATAKEISQFTMLGRLFGQYYQVSNDMSELTKSDQSHPSWHRRPIRNTLPVAIVMDTGSHEEKIHLASAMKPTATVDETELGWRVLTEPRHVARAQEAAASVKSTLIRALHRDQANTTKAMLGDLLEKLAI